MSKIRLLLAFYRSYSRSYSAYEVSSCPRWEIIPTKSLSSSSYSI